MNLADPLVLVADLTMIQADLLSTAARDELGCGPGDVVLTRRGSRTPSRIVSRDLGELLRRFERPATIVAALIDYCAADGPDPRDLLESSVRALVPLISAGWLAPVGAASSAVAFSLEPGDRFGEFVILDQIQAVEDSEVYRAVDRRGSQVAVKMAKKAAGSDVIAQFDNEMAVLSDAAVWPAPRLVAAGECLDRRFLATEWVAGTAITLVARDLRTAGDEAALLRLGCAAAGSYSALHGSGIVHGDVYPRNILVDEHSRVWLVDFGHGHRTGVPAPPGWLRKGSPEFYDPQFADSLRTRSPAPDPTPTSDQYSLGAVLYTMFTGRHYLDLSPQSGVMLEQIVHDAPVTFRRGGTRAWPALEAIILRTLEKEPANRFGTADELHGELLRVRRHPRRHPKSLRDERRQARELVDGLNLADVLASRRFPRASVVHGAAGVAAGYLELAVSGDSARDLESADLWCRSAARASGGPEAFTSSELDLTAERIGHGSVHYGSPGVDLVSARIAQAMNDSQSLVTAVDGLSGAAKRATSDELALGRAGLLLAAALILDDQPDDSVADAAASSAIVAVRDLGEATLQALLDSPTQASHLGMAHGEAGILMAALTWCEVTATDAAPALHRRLDLLGSLAHEHGRGLRWPTRPAPAPGNYFESWCHGTPGHVLLWTTAARVIDDKYLDLADRAALTIATSDAANATLCCGSTGRAYAYLAMHRATGHKNWVRRAETEAAQAWRNRNTGVSPSSLFQGALGAAVLLLTLSDPHRCTFPLIERWR